MTDSYRHDYRTLQVEPGCSLAALKAARRGLVQTWHPDRFPSGSASKREAEEKIKEINTAFARLFAYHKRFGTLPIPESSERPPAGPRADEPHVSVRTAPVGSSRRSRDAVVSDQAHSHESGRSLRWGLVIAILALVAAAVHTVLDHERERAFTYDMNPPVERQPVPPFAPSTRPPSGPATHFTVGSSLGEVYAVQGVPTSVENNVWRYGESTVYFENGAVVSWDHDPASPLRAVPAPKTPREPAPTFTVGSTKAEVRRAQGRPLIETDALWDYGLSKIYFRDGRVIGWDSSPMRPLKTRE